MSDMQNKEITNSERIRRIIDIQRLDGREIEINLPNYIEVAKIVDTAQDGFTVKITDSFINLRDENIDSVFINFVFSGVELFGSSKILNLSESALTLGYPEAIGSRSKRRYPRIRLDRSITAKVKLKQIPVGHKGEISSKDVPVQYSKIYWEVQRDEVEIKKIFLMVGTEIRKISPFSEIVLFNKSNIQMRDARVLRKSGKVLYVDDCKKIQSYTRFIPSDKIVSYSFLLNELKLQGLEKQKILQELKEIVKENLARGCTAKALAPIFSKDEVIGCVKVLFKDKTKKLTFETVSEVMSLAALLTMAIEKAKFIPDLDDAVKSSLLEVSEGGLYLKISDSGDSVEIKEGTNIEVRLLLDDEELTLKGNVLRKDESTKSYAVELVGLDSDNHSVLKHFVEKSIGELKKKSEQEPD